MRLGQRWRVVSRRVRNPDSSTVIDCRYHSAHLEVARLEAAPDRAVFKVSRTPKFVEKLEDIVGLYMSAPEHALMLSLISPWAHCPPSFTLCRAKIWAKKTPRGETPAESKEAVQSFAQHK